MSDFVRAECTYYCDAIGHVVAGIWDKQTDKTGHSSKSYASCPHVLESLRGAPGRAKSRLSDDLCCNMRDGSDVRAWRQEGFHKSHCRCWWQSGLNRVLGHLAGKNGCDFVLENRCVDCRSDCASKSPHGHAQAGDGRDERVGAARECDTLKEIINPMSRYLDWSGVKGTYRGPNKDPPDAYGAKSANCGGKVGVIWIAVHQSTSQRSLIPSSAIVLKKREGCGGKPPTRSHQGKDILISMALINIGQRTWPLV